MQIISKTLHWARRLMFSIPYFMHHSYLNLAHKPNKLLEQSGPNGVEYIIEVAQNYDQFEIKAPRSTRI
jgi:hypothetical protein